MFIKIRLSNIVYWVLLFMCFSFSACKKSNPGAGGAGNNSGLMHPIAVSFYDGNNSAYPTTWNYTYDSKNQLTKYGAENSWIKDIGTSGHVLTTWSSTFIFATSYMYTRPHATDSIANIYNENPNKLYINLKAKDLALQSVTEIPQGFYALLINPKQQILHMNFSNFRDFAYSYDEKGNLSKVNFYDTHLENPPPYSRLTVNAVDDKRSPFSAVPRFNFIAWPVAYPVDYALAYCTNNPLSITVESADPEKGWVLYEKDTFSYEYNEQGYPKKISVTIEYPNSPGEKLFTKTFNYTYKSL